MDAVTTTPKPEFFTPPARSPFATQIAVAPTTVTVAAPVQANRASGVTAVAPQMVNLSDAAVVAQANDNLQRNWRVMAGAPAVPGAADAFRSATRQPLEGYDQTKLDNPEHRTPKYIFGRVAQNFKLDSVQSDKGRAEQLLKAMVPDLLAAGLEVVGVSGDKIQVKTELGYEWVDVIRGAGAPNPGWWWGSEGVGTPQPTSTPKEWAAQTGLAQAAMAQASPMMAGAAAATANDGPKVLGGQIDSGRVLNILRRFPANGQGLTQAVRDPELQRMYPGVMTFGGVGNDGKAFNADDRLRRGLNVDKLFFPNGAIVDVIVSAGAANANWGWLPEN